MIQFVEEMRIACAQGGIARGRLDGRRRAGLHRRRGYRGDGGARSPDRAGFITRLHECCDVLARSCRCRCSPASRASRSAPAWRSRRPAIAHRLGNRALRHAGGQARNSFRRRSGALADARRLGADAPDPPSRRDFHGREARDWGFVERFVPADRNWTRRSRNGSRRSWPAARRRSVAEAAHPRLGRAQAERRRRRRYRGFR